MSFRSGILVVLLTAVPAWAANPVLSGSLGARGFVDRNLFLQDDAPFPSEPPAGLPGVAANESAAGLEISATVRARWTAPARSAELSYAPSMVRYEGHASENHDNHVIAGTFAATAGFWTTDVRLKYHRVDGSRLAPVYVRLGGAPAVGGEPVRARRAQAIGRGSAILARRVGSGFVRATFTALDQDFLTDAATLSGYCNYTDRAEHAAGVETGRPLVPGLDGVVAVRFGRQRQADVLGAPLNFSNRFARYLLGVEGSPAKSWKVALLAGPDFRRFGASRRPNSDRDQSTGYGEASATWSPTARDSVTFAAKRFLWLAGTGRGIYVDTTAEAGWRRQLSSSWSCSLLTRVHDGDTSHFNAWAPRHDRIYTGIASVSRRFSSGLRFDLEFQHDRADSFLTETPGREYRRSISSVSLVRSW